MTRRHPGPVSLIAGAVLLLGGTYALGRGEQPPPVPVGIGHTPAEAARRWVDADGKPLPFDSEEQILEFLRTAEVKADKEITSGGITMPRKILLEKDGVHTDAIFRQVDEQKMQGNTGGGRNDLFFRDCYIFEPAAYELSRMLGLDNVPPATLRKIKNTKGSVQIWLEHAMTDTKKTHENIQPPDEQQWNKQVQIMNVFDALVYNTDRNRGNILIDADWKLWMIDHTRAFRRIPDLQHVEMLKLCERNLYHNLQALDEPTTRERLKEYLNGYELDALFKRRKMILDHYAKLITEKGEEHVLYTYTPTSPTPAAPAAAAAAPANPS